VDELLADQVDLDDPVDLDVIDLVKEEKFESSKSQLHYG
jgi:hypothetical protein